MNQLAMNRRGFLKGAAALGALAAVAPALAGSVDLVEADEASSRIVLGRPVDSDNLDPVTCVGNVNIFMFNLIIEGLVKTSDGGTDIEPALADSWEVSEDGKTYTFHVKEGLTFSDGSPVTAEDWQWTFDRAIQTTDSNWYECVENIDHVETPDDTTVIVVTKEAAASTLANLSIFELGVQSKAYYDSVGADEYKNGIIGTGAYMLKEWKKGEYMTFSANPNYREEGLPLTQEIEFKVVADDSSRTIQLQGGDIDIASEVPFSTMQQLESDANCSPHPDAGTMVYWVSLNTQNEYLSNQQVREALYTATDSQTVVDMVSYGYASTAGSIVSSSSQYCDTSIPAPVADVEKAKQLLADAGYPNGFTIRLLLRGGNATNEQMATVLQFLWSQIGVTLEIDQRESTAYSEARRNLDLDCVISGWSDDVPDPTSLMQFAFDYSVTQGYYTGMEQPEDMQALNEQAKIELDVEKRKELYSQIQQGFREEAIYIPLMQVPWQNAIRNDIDGFVQTPMGNYRFTQLTRK